MIFHRLWNFEENNQQICWCVSQHTSDKSLPLLQHLTWNKKMYLAHGIAEFYEISLRFETLKYDSFNNGTESNWQKCPQMIPNGINTTCTVKEYL